VNRALRTLLRSVMDGPGSDPAPPPPAPVPADPYAARRARQQDIEKSVQVEIHRALIANTLDYIKTTSQVLSGVTGVLLSTYIALLVGFRRDTGINGIGEWFCVLIPVMLWLASIASAFVMAVASPRQDLVVLDLRAARETYGQVLRARRNQLIAPAILTLFGLVAFAALFNPVFVNPRRAAAAGAGATSSQSATPQEPPAARPGGTSEQSK